MAERHEHLGSRRFSEYLAGMLDEASALAFEAHIAACDRCARTLQLEAQLEVELFAAAEPAAGPRLPRIERAARWACAVMAAAAAVLLVLTDPTHYLQLHRIDEVGRGAQDVVALFSDSVCMPPSEGEDASCEEPALVALATIPPSVSFSAGDGCWGDAEMIDPLCVTTDPLAG